MTRLGGLDGRQSPDDMKPSSSASQSEMADDERGDDSPEEVCRYSDGGLRCFPLCIAFRKYLICFLFVRSIPLLTPPFWRGETL